MYTKKTSKKNFFYNFLSNIINIIFPLITSPYVSRILGADNLGKFNFSNSFANWFLIFATFGTTNYGIREIAKVRDNRKELDKTFSEIFYINFIATTITICVYIVVIFVSPKTNKEIMLFIISALLIFMNLFCIDWFYMGIEEFKLIALRSLAIKVICLISIFIFINSRNDYIIYAFINVIAFGLTNIYNFFYSRKYVSLTFKDINLLKHIDKLKIFFLSSLIISMYTTFDQVFLGFESSSKSVAFYSRSKQIYSIALSITLSISTVLLPRLTNMRKNDFNSYKKLLKKSINYIYFFSVPSVFGIIFLSKDIMWFFGGKEFENAYISLIIISSLVFTVSLSTWQYNQLFLPLGKEKVGLKCQAFMAVISIISNIILVPKFQYIGASISIVLTETVGTIYGVYYAKHMINEVKIRYVTHGLRRYLLASVIMSIGIIIFKQFKYNYLINILFGIVIGSCIYFSILYIFKDSIVNEFIGYINSKFINKLNGRKNEF